jgi:hypothetical protein
MQRISFDFMTRKLRQIFRENASKRSQRKARENKTLEEAIKDEKQREFEKQFIPETRWGSWLRSNPAEANTRQERRRLKRIEAFNEITKRFPGELRRRRRAMAFAFVRNMAKKAA